MKSPPKPAARPGTFSHIAGLFGAATQYFAARLTLLGLEAKEAGVQYGIAAAMLAGALCVALLGYILLVITAVFGIAVAFDAEYAWIVIMGGAALLHAGGAALLLFLAWRRVRTGAFSRTLEEFKKDRQWMTKLANNR